MSEPGTQCPQCLDLARRLTATERELAENREDAEWATPQQETPT